MDVVSDSDSAESVSKGSLTSFRRFGNRFTEYMVYLFRYVLLILFEVTILGHETKIRYGVHYLFPICKTFPGGSH